MGILIGKIPPPLCHPDPKGGEATAFARRDLIEASTTRQDTGAGQARPV